MRLPFEVYTCTAVIWNRWDGGLSIAGVSDVSQIFVDEYLIRKINNTQSSKILSRRHFHCTAILSRKYAYQLTLKLKQKPHESTKLVLPRKP